MKPLFFVLFFVLANVTPNAVQASNSSEELFTQATGRPILRKQTHPGFVPVEMAFSEDCSVYMDATVKVTRAPGTNSTITASEIKNITLSAEVFNTVVAAAKGKVITGPQIPDAPSTVYTAHLLLPDGSAKEVMLTRRGSSEATNQSREAKTLTTLLDRLCQ